MAKTLDEAGVKRLIQEIKGANKNLNTPIPISTENTPESMAQNVKNIADYVAKAKAAGIANVNGMAVTCLLIEEDYSGVGYLYGDTTNVTVCGIMLTDDAIDGKFFSIQSTGEYHYNFIISSGDGNVDSGLLDKGARKPIILTTSTTEVDEETYQKLLSDNVDVVFKTQGGDPNICILTYKYDDGDAWSFTFSCFSREGDSFSATYLYAYEVRITKTGNPHPCRVIDNAKEKVFNAILLNEGFINKSTLSPVLQEIDLTGTDADRKAKLDQFETDWKALTGASDLTGARFVGFLYDSNQKLTDGFGVFTFDVTNNGYSSICSNVNYEMPTLITIDRETGSITITPLFSHLEAITIRTGNTPDDKAANVAAIEAYEDNLEALGVDVTKGYMIPIRTSSLENIVGFIIPNMTDTGYVGLGEIGNGNGGNLYISNEGNFSMYRLQDRSDDNLTTTSKSIVGAINEVNALAKGYSTIFTPIELTTETAQNKTAIDARVAAFTAQGITLTNGCCIPVTYKGVYAGNISLINGDWYGLLVKNTNNPADNINIKLSADGTITEGNSAQ